MIRFVHKMHQDKFFESGFKLDFEGATVIEEVEIRNAIGRIYYYIYHEVLIWINSDSALNPIYQNIDEKSYHKKLRKVFQEIAIDTNDTVYGTIYRMLGLLHQSRCDCDYDLDESIDSEFFDTFIANFASLKQAVFNLNQEIFKLFECEIFEEIATTSSSNASIAIFRKKSSLRPLE